MSTDHLVRFRSNIFGQSNPIGDIGNISSQGPGGGGAVVTTTGYNSVGRRYTIESEVTGFGVGNFQIFDGGSLRFDPALRYPPFPALDRTFRIRQNVGFQYKSGTGVSRVGWGVMLDWSSLLLSAPGAALDLGFIGFIWYQGGAVATTLRAVAGDHLGVNRFDQITTIPAVVGTMPVFHNLRIDFHGIDKTIIYLINEVVVATYTPVAGDLGGISVVAYRFGLGVNAQNGNVCSGFRDTIGGGGWIHDVNPTMPDPGAGT